MITLPKKYKKEITALIKEFEHISRPRDITIILPPKKISVNLQWHDQQEYDLVTEYYITKVLKGHKVIKRHNKELRDFCAKANKLGKKIFGHKFGIWENLLWPSTIPKITWK